ncbi:STAS/SEC14 domain-containing protein [Rhodoferax aquaticus]|uniref:STAS/SEC14 domain-containing protein n=1 Tax=Rhodoferax aquaticus TaxID=2527691 RepID=A0A515EJY1_9BURK|nr:STAS/SEC14 domain-containing protein [Rhodoferax aquaticus]QDL52984.1 STAS/SEC14 domain-containing protein [Rhodoferax aquaticus]
MTIHIAYELPTLIVATVTDVLMREELDDAKRQIHDHLQAHGPCRLLVFFAQGFINLQALATWDDIDVDPYLQRNTTRMALVGDMRWRDSALLFFFNSMVPFQMEYFPPEQYELAKAWLID